MTAATMLRVTALERRRVDLSRIVFTEDRSKKRSSVCFSLSQQLLGFLPKHCKKKLNRSENKECFVSSLEKKSKSKVSFKIIKEEKKDQKTRRNSLLAVILTHKQSRVSPQAL